MCLVRRTNIRFCTQEGNPFRVCSGGANQALPDLSATPLISLYVLSTHTSFYVPSSRCSLAIILSESPADLHVGQILRQPLGPTQTF